MDTIEVIVVLALTLTIVGAHVWIAAWLVRDAQRRGHSGAFVVLFWIFGPLAALGWLILRPRKTLLDRSPYDDSDPETALLNASKLDSLGEWDAAEAVYRSASERWPEHAEYVAKCIEAIERKRAAASAESAVV